MTRSTLPSRLHIILFVTLSLVLIWSGAAFELQRSRLSLIHESEVKTSIAAQVLAEYSRSTFKRIDEVILDIRGRWTGDWKAFASLVQHKQANIGDITFQVAVIDRDGMLAFSNLAKPADRIDLSEREHFQIHKNAGYADNLFISRPLKGKVSGKWSIQVTRPIFKGGEFDGVLVVSVGPEQFAHFAKALGIGNQGAMTIIRSTGEIMARYPAMDEALGFVVKDRPFLGNDSPISGSYQAISLTDGIDRVWGFYRVPELGLNLTTGESLESVLEPYIAYRTKVLAVALALSLLGTMFMLLLYRSLRYQEESRMQLNTIFNLSPDGFVSFDAERRVKFVSPAFVSMTGLAVKEISGLDEEAFATRLAGLCQAHAVFPALSVLRAQRAEEAGSQDAKPATRARRLIEMNTAGKRVLEVDIRVADSDSVSQILCFRDVTHETEVAQMKSEFLSTAAHELRTPMASILGFSELMLNAEFSPEEQRTFIETIHRQSVLISSIINELLDLVRIESRRGKDFNFSEVDAGQLLRQAVDNFTNDKGLSTLSYEPAEQPLVVRADQKKLMQALNNVLSNAQKYSPKGDPVQVELIPAANDEQPGLVGIRITDHGIGMSPEQVSRVFERFYRADHSGKIPGSGLGMSIVKEIIELHAGKVTVSSRLSKGTTVTLWLPTA